MDLAQNHFFKDICSIIEMGRRQAYAEVSRIMLETYWKLGQRIVEEEQNGNKRAEYGIQLIDDLAKQLTFMYGKGFSARYLRAFRAFYLVFPDYEIWKSRFPNLTWTHVASAFWFLRMKYLSVLGLSTLFGPSACAYYGLC